MSDKCPYCGQDAVIKELGGLTERQANLLAWLRTWDWSTGKSPTYTEICGSSGFKSRSQVFHTLRALQERGFLRLLHNRARSAKLRTASGGQNGTSAEGSVGSTDVQAILPASGEEC